MWELANQGNSVGVPRNGFCDIQMQTLRRIVGIWNRVKGQCEEYDRLQSEVEQVLADITQVTTLQLQLFRAQDIPQFTRVDKELELLVGKKERAFGALRQHAADHKCQAIDPGDRGGLKDTA